MPRASEGIQVRHRNGCAAQTAKRARCTCERPSYRGSIYNPQTKKALRGPWVESKGTAEGWRADELRKLRNGTHDGGDRFDETIDAAWDKWEKLAEDGKITPRKSKYAYKASSLSSYRSAMKKVSEKFGQRMLSSITHAELQEWADELAAGGMARATVAGVFDPLRAIYRKAHEDHPRIEDPVGWLSLPAKDDEEIEYVEPEQARALLAALDDKQRAIWSMAFFTGLRRSELRALRVRDLRFDQGVVVLSRAWTTAEEKPREPKSTAGTRRVPIAGCEAELKAHIERLGIAGDDLLFPSVRDPSRPFCPATIERQAKATWKAAGLEPTRLHIARHSFATWCFEEGMNVKVVQTYMGHSSVTTTMNRYVKSWQGQEAEHGQRLAAFMAA